MFEDVYSKAKTAADYAGKKTGEFVEVTKLRMSASDMQSKICKEYQELGQVVYSASKEGKDCGEQVRVKVESVDAMYAELSKINEKIAELKRLKKCAECGFANAEDSVFCSKCGAKL